MDFFIKNKFWKSTFLIHFSNSAVKQLSEILNVSCVIPFDYVTWDSEGIRESWNCLVRKRKLVERQFTFYLLYNAVCHNLYNFFYIKLYQKWQLYYWILAWQVISLRQKIEKNIYFWIVLCYYHENFLPLYNGSVMLVYN